MSKRNVVVESVMCCCLSADGELYAGTSVDFMGANAAIFRTTVQGSSQHYIRTEAYDQNWLNGLSSDSSYHKHIISLSHIILTSLSLCVCHQSLSSSAPSPSQTLTARTMTRCTSSSRSGPWRRDSGTRGCTVAWLESARYKRQRQNSETQTF